MPLGEGYSVEEQVTGAAEHGWLQIIVYPMKSDRYRALQHDRTQFSELEESMCMSMETSMGLAPGGRMKQEIYDDPYNLDDWDQRHFSRCFVTIANSEVWGDITNERAPTLPPSAVKYTGSGLPWFDYYGGDAEAVEGSETLKEIQSVAAVGATKSAPGLFDDQSVDVGNILTLRKMVSSQVRETTI